MTDEVTYEVVSPVGEPAAEASSLSPRIADLNGKTVCQVWNGSYQADKVFRALGDALKERFPNVNIVPWHELPKVSHFGDVGKCLKEMREAAIQKRCDAVITSTGG